MDKKLNISFIRNPNDVYAAEVEQLLVVEKLVDKHPSVVHLQYVDGVTTIEELAEAIEQQEKSHVIVHCDLDQDYIPASTPSLSHMRFLGQVIQSPQRFEQLDRLVLVSKRPMPEECTKACLNIAEVQQDRLGFPYLRFSFKRGRPMSKVRILG